MPELLKKHPLLQIQLKHDLSRNVLQNILNNQIDVGLVMNPESHPDLIIKEIAQDEVNVWKMKSGSTADTLIYDPSLFQTQWVLKQLQKKGHKFSRKIESSSLEVITSLLRAGTGHAILPKRVAQQSPFPMEASFHGIPSYKDSLCLVYRPSFRKTALGRAVIDSMSGL
jgi:DNA-binding transcriptional LysR family regulator